MSVWPKFQQAIEVGYRLVAARICFPQAAQSCQSSQAVDLLDNDCKLTSVPFLVEFYSPSINGRNAGKLSLEPLGF